MKKLLWLIVAVLAVIVIVGCAGFQPYGSGGLFTGSIFPSHASESGNTFMGSTANLTPEGQDTRAEAVSENLERMQSQGIAPPCEDIQKNCDVPGPVPAETYTQAELTEVNTVPASTAEQIARIASAGTCGSRNICLS